MTVTKRPIVVGNCSGAGGDGPDQMYRLATEGPIDAIFSDYLAEVNIAWRALEVQKDPSAGYEKGFLTHLSYKTAAKEVAEKGIKLIHDGGALNPYGLYKETKALLKEKGLDYVKVAWVDGDNVTPQIISLAESEKMSYPHLDIPGVNLSSVKSSILTANAYIGMRGIVAALTAGAQIVICGRICDASPVMALAAWWHGWSDTEYDQLAGSLIAGHVTECGPYTTGGNFCDFQNIPKLHKVGYPIAEIASDGSCVITLHEGSNGAVTVDTVKAQIVYEIQGPTYLNPDVAAQLEEVRVEKIGENRILISGVKGTPPPPTTKLAVCTFGGYQAEVSTYAVGLDCKEKALLQKAQVMDLLQLDKYSKISIDTYGSVPEDPKSQKDCSVQIRHFVQAPTQEAIQAFSQAFFFTSMQGYGGYHLNMDLRTIAPKPYVTYFPGKIDQSVVKVKAHVEFDEPIIIEPVENTAIFTGQKSYDPENPAPLDSFGPTEKCHLGRVVLARSGDKAGNANVGLWVRSADEWLWLRSYLTISTFKYLLGDDYKAEYRVERFEMPHLHAVHFVTYGILEDGVSSSSLIDGFAKSFGEFIRARIVEVPKVFLAREWVNQPMKPKHLIGLDVMGNNVNSANHFAGDLQGPKFL